MFPFLQVQTQTKHENVIPLIASHLWSLSEKLHKYFLSLSSDTYGCVKNQFTEFSPSTENLLSLQEEEELNEQTNSAIEPWKWNSVKSHLTGFGSQQSESESFVISGKALDVLLQSSAPYVCEQAFSCITVIKSKSRNRLLSVEEEMHVCLSKIGSRISDIRSKMKCHTEGKAYNVIG